MQQFTIYHTTEELLIKSTILLIEKCYYGNLKTIVLTPNQELQELLNKTLWTYSRKQFIPHGSKLDNNPEKQPIYITNEMENPNSASVLLIVSTIFLEEILKNQEYITKFQRIILIYDTTTALEELVSQINKLVTISVSCYKQNPNGSWNMVN